MYTFAVIFIHGNYIYNLDELNISLQFQFVEIGCLFRVHFGNVLASLINLIYISFSIHIAHRLIIYLNTDYIFKMN